LRATPSKKRGLTEAARAMQQVIEMHSVTGDDCMIARVVARSVEELAEILQRLSMFGDSSTSVVLETLIPLRNPIPAQKPEAAAKQSTGAVRSVRSGGNGSLQELP
jgi:Lrp/AsnC family leucine-responsive transcriptional regulator